MGNRRLCLGVALAVALTAVLLPAVAEAGCFTENDSCVQCARQDFRRAMFRLDLGGIREANLALWDCNIDLYHCIILGAHHDAPCSL